MKTKLASKPTATPPIKVLANRTYYLGASTSPALVYVLSVTDEAIRYSRTASMQFDRETSVIRTSRGIAESLIAQGTATMLGQLRASTKLRSCAWYDANIAKLEAQLAGQETAEESLDTYLGETIRLVATSPVDPSKGRDGDPRYSAEQYGGVGGLTVDGVMIYEIRTTVAEARLARKDPRFREVKVVDGQILETA